MEASSRLWLKLRSIGLTANSFFGRPSRYFEFASREEPFGLLNFETNFSETLNS